PALHCREHRLDPCAPCGDAVACAVETSMGRTRVRCCSADRHPSNGPGMVLRDRSSRQFNHHRHQRETAGPTDGESDVSIRETSFGKTTDGRPLRVLELTSRAYVNFKVTIDVTGI